MADDSPSKSTKLAPYLFDLLALAFILGAEEAFRAGTSWHVWAGELTSGILCGAIGLRWTAILSFMANRNPWHMLRQAETRTLELSRRYAASVAEEESLRERLAELQAKEASVTPSKLSIHSAFYGLGDSNDLDVTETLRSMIPVDALAVRINNNLIVGCADPAPNQRKTLTVAYSYGNDKNIQFSRPEFSLLVLPRDRELIEETAGAYQKQIDVLQKKLDAESLKRSYNLPPDASNEDKKRRERVGKGFDRLSVPQRFTLRLISKHPGIGFNQLVQFAAEAGFGDSPHGYINEMTMNCDLLKIGVGNTFAIDPAFIGDVDVVLMAWFMRISSTSEALF